MHRVALPRLAKFEAWRDHARRFAARGVTPELIDWQMEGAAAGLFDDTTALPPDTPSKPVTVPKAFPALARQLCASRAPDAFALAYRLLLRLSVQPRLLSNRADPDVNRAETLAKNIRRDMHKMKAFVRFREVTETDADRRQFVAWFEPDHRIEELVAGFFARRFADMDWMIVTPEVTTAFTDGKIRHKAVASTRPDLSDETETLWKTYYANIFNPARLKIKAMQSEMPKKYWKNLPEAELIPDLIAQAEAQVADMRAAPATLPPLRAARVLDRLQQSGAPDTPQGLKAELTGCARCPLAANATQAVPGAGPQDAALMIVGEQPGDAEDLAGRPFVGPAGQLFDQIAQEAGLDQNAAYVTNAVKHFKFQVRGKRRIHQSPSKSEISHCKWWLDREIALISPRLIVALGATAALSLTGDGKGITARRGQVEMGLSGVPVFITLHPAALLRHPDATERDALRAALRADLAQVSQMIKEIDAAPAAAS